MDFLSVRDLVVGYGHADPVLKQFSLTLSQGEFVALLGPSGCGKTTALRTILGFVPARDGRIVLEGRDITRLPAYRRHFGVVYQSYALFPHLTVFDNVAFGLKMRHMARKAIEQRVPRWLELVDLSDLAKRLPGQLSGGQCQRVALARALAVEPLLLLLDEPLSNLDAKLRAEMRVELRRIQKELGTTAIFVTHDQLEALSMADRVALLNKGQIEQIATPKALYRDPRTPFVARFMGYDNRFAARVVAVDGDAVTLRAGEIRLDGRAAAGSSLVPGAPVEAAFRPEAARLEMGSAEENRVPGEVRFASFQGSTTRYIVDTVVGEVSVIVPESQTIAGEAAVVLCIERDNLIVYPADDGAMAEQGTET
jgi:putative spermidine/putrescine transport system ATP-binding protein